MAARTIDIRDKLTRETKASSRPSLLAAGPSKTEKVLARGRRAISEEPDESLDSNGPEADADGESTQDEESIMRMFWQGRRDQGLRESVFDEKPSKSSETLPTGWTVVSISLSKERNSIVLTRRSGCATLSDLVFSLPIDRQARREGEEEELTIDAALEEMNDIVTSSNDLTASAKNISDSAEMDARKMWWTGRRELDDRLRLLCESIELRWLGPFKSTFMDPLPVDRDSSAMTVLRSAFDRIVKRLCFPSGTLKKGSKVKLDEAILEVVAGLSSTNVTDEELEDLLHFIADVHQFNGVPVAVDEADLDEITVDLRSALEDFRSTCTKVRRAQQEQEVDHHIFLILDKDTAPIPWESIPALRGRAVCRIPSMSFLQDRVEMARRLGASQDNDGAFHLPRECKTYYLLNPSGDLAKSQKRFEGYLRSIPNSRGLIGKAPGPNEYLDALGSHSLVLYFGHSGGEQYVKTTRLRALQRCAVTMLWGCSSAVLRDQGEYDRTGTPHNYMIAGAPAVVGQLFDATDKELDCLSESVLLHLGLKGEPSEDLKAAMKSSKARFDKMSLARAVAESRDCCRLPYLTGSAPVVYGVPVYFDRD
ncbi:hypothetical protein BCV69DRAFT_245602 [Microstroma glucosiphilum]|uniref:separase n=1 Tax=Pseudomicrostroma glucosiphilum TaxID=1684307 RepID=A0A316UG88_9BASI|nr:hypothetical protein BCV69DRAFT_245602 [Pseudomicrostroma glucosiphilum]PWN23381.1 hypothetical protein BCV69DRAFT_245602 [Pseudomicrostroma glucosiphilum]